MRIIGLLLIMVFIFSCKSNDDNIRRVTASVNGLNITWHDITFIEYDEYFTIQTDCYRGRRLYLRFPKETGRYTKDDQYVTLGCSFNRDKEWVCSNMITCIINDESSYIELDRSDGSNLQGIFSIRCVKQTGGAYGEFTIEY